MSLMAAIFPPLNLSFHALGGIIDVEANPFFKIIGGLSSGSKSALASCGQIVCIASRFDHVIRVPSFIKRNTKAIFLQLADTCHL